MYDIRDDYADCGSHMVRELNPEFRKLEAKIEKIMKRCQEIDPEAPKTKTYKTGAQI